MNKVKRIFSCAFCMWKFYNTSNNDFLTFVNCAQRLRKVAKSGVQSKFWKGAVHKMSAIRGEGNLSIADILQIRRGSSDTDVRDRKWRIETRYQRYEVSAVCFNSPMELFQHQNMPKAIQNCKLFENLSESPLSKILM